MIERWEADQPKIAPAPHAPARPNSKRHFWLGLAVGIANKLAYLKSPVTTQGADYNNDGKPDEFWTLSPRGRYLIYKFDRNLNGQVDYKVYFDHQGLVKSGESDDNFDGVFETKISFDAGNIDVTEADTNGDDLPELRTQYAHGVPVLIEHLNPATGLPLRIEFIKLGKITKAEIDTDHNGTLDTRQKYNAFGELIATETLTN